MYYLYIIRKLDKGRNYSRFFFLIFNWHWKNPLFPIYIIILEKKIRYKETKIHNISLTVFSKNKFKSQQGRGNHFEIKIFD